MDFFNDTNVPKGWQRSEVKRKNGVSKGKIDIQFTSPKGKLFRSKKELWKYINEKKLSLDINNFNFSTKSKNNTSFSQSNRDAQTDVVLTDDTRKHLAANSSVMEKILISSQDASTQSPDSGLGLSFSILGNDWVMDDTIQYNKYIFKYLLINQ
uniref:MBD domain-containing protein n=1 Tax=Graphocephala atropunctata TaxID=36148 RepID=A0A1B6LTU7_9HEMI